MNTLYEFDPGTLLTGVRGVSTHVGNALNSLKNTAKIIAKKSKGKGRKAYIKNFAQEISNTAKNDNTLLGDAVRTLETGRQGASAVLLQNLEPLPTADIQSVKQTIESLLFAIKRGDTKSKSKLLDLFKKFGIDASQTPETMKQALNNPTKAAKDLVLRRATADTYAGSGLTNYNGLMSKTLGLTGPIVDNGNIMTAFQGSGMDPITYARMVTDWSKAGLGVGLQKLKQGVHKLKRPYSFFGQNPAPATI